MALPVAAIVSIVLGCWVILVLALFALYQFLKGRGNCNCECAPCGKEDTPTCECCVSLSETCNCCNPSLNGCLNSVCPTNKKISCIDIFLCQCCAGQGEQSCCLKGDGCCCSRPICCEGGPKCQFDICKCDDLQGDGRCCSRPICCEGGPKCQFDICKCDDLQGDGRCCSRPICCEGGPKCQFDICKCDDLQGDGRCCSRPICCDGGPKCQFDSCKCCDDQPDKPPRECCRRFNCFCMACECRNCCGTPPPTPAIALTDSGHHLVNTNLSVDNVNSINDQLASLGVPGFFVNVDGLVKIRVPPQIGTTSSEPHRPSGRDSGLNKIYSPHGHASAHAHLEQPQPFHNEPGAPHDEHRAPRNEHRALPIPNELRPSRNELRVSHNELRALRTEPRAGQARDTRREIHIDPDVPSDVMRPGRSQSSLQRNWRDLRASVPDIEEELPIPRTLRFDV